MTLVTLVAWVAAAGLGSSLIAPGAEIAPWWPATGVAVAGARLLSGEHRRLLIVLLGVVAAAGGWVDGRDTETIVAFGITTPAQTAIGATVLDRLNGDATWWTDRNHVVNLIIAGLAAGAVSGILGTIVIRESQEPISFALAWLGADMLGLLTVVPVAEALVLHGGRLDPPRSVAALAIGVPVLHWTIDTLLVQPFGLLALAAIGPSTVVVAATRTGPQATSMTTFTMVATSTAMARSGRGVLGAQDALPGNIQLAVLFGAIASLALAFTAASMDRRRTESARDAATALLDLAFEGAPVPLAMLDRQGLLIRANSALQELAGSVDEGGRLTDLFEPADRRRVVATLQSCVRDGGTSRLDAQLARGDGPPRDIALTLVTVRSSSAPDTVLASLVDMTERVRTSRELRAAVEKEQAAATRLKELDTLRDTFVRAISHDLRTPLSPLLGLSNLLSTRLDRLEPAQVSALAERIAHNGRRVQRLLDDLDDLTRLGIGVEDSSRRTDDPARVVREAVEAAEDAEHPITLELDERPAFVDAITLRRITHNLVANAMRHTARDTPVRVLLSVDGQGGHGHLELIVEDDGQGVPDEHKERIFSDFTQGPGTHTSGSGVGLALVREFARARGGRAHVEDAASGGARFVVRLPLVGPGGQHATTIVPAESTKDRQVDGPS